MADNTIAQFKNKFNEDICCLNYLIICVKNGINYFFNSFKTLNLKHFQSF